MDVLTTEHKNQGSNPTINDRAVTVVDTRYVSGVN